MTVHGRILLDHQWISDRHERKEKWIFLIEQLPFSYERRLFHMYDICVVFVYC